MSEVNYQQQAQELSMKRKLELADEVGEEAAKVVVEMRDLQLLQNLANLSQDVYRGNRRHLMEDEVRRFLQDIAAQNLPTEDVLEWKASRKESKESLQEWRLKAMEMFIDLLPCDDGL